MALGFFFNFNQIIVLFVLQLGIDQLFDIL